MTGTQTGRAHCLSLPLFAAMMQVKEGNLEQATGTIRDRLSALFLVEHVDVVLLLKDGELSIDLEALSDFGKDVLAELETRNSFIPCPPGECSYDANGLCLWCGEASKA